MKTTLSRRTVLRGSIGGVLATVGLPRLQSMLNENGSAWAAGGALPRRFGMWTWSNGVHLGRWVPKTTGTGWDAPELLALLSPLRTHVSVVTGMETKYGVGKGHLNCHTNLLTGSAVVKIGSMPTAAGPSIDQIIANSVGMTTPFKSIEVGVDNGLAHERESAARYFSHTAPNSPNVPIYDCRELFERIFSKPVAGPGAAPEAARLAAARAAYKKRIVDVVREDTMGLSKKLGAADRIRLAQHLDGIDAIEKRLIMADAQVGGAGASACPAPGKPSVGLVNVPVPNGTGGDSDSTKVSLEGMSPVINKTMAELLAVALSCDLTRVFTFQYSGPGSRAMLPSAKISDYHGTTHTEGYKGAIQPRCFEVTKHYMRELDVFLRILLATPDGAGTLLDNCAILGTTDVAEGVSHSPSNFPMLVIGRAGGALKPGVHYRSATAESATKVPLTLARAVGVQMPSFGTDKQLVTDGVADLLT